MGMLIDFYAGDSRRIVDAWRRDDGEALADPGVVAAHADLSFHLSPEALDQLVLSACSLMALPPMSFAESVRGDASGESGIHETSDAFRDLLAGVPPELAGQLYDRWMARLPEPPAPAPETRGRRRLRAVRRGLEEVLVAAILLPLAAGYWLVSRRFRQERRLNRARREAVAKAGAAPPAGETLRDAVASLVDTCRTAKERRGKVLYAWTL